MGNAGQQVQLKSLHVTDDGGQVLAVCLGASRHGDQVLAHQLHIVIDAAAIADGVQDVGDGVAVALGQRGKDEVVFLFQLFVLVAELHVQSSSPCKIWLTAALAARQAAVNSCR